MNISLKPVPVGPALEVGLTDEIRWVVAAADGSVVDVDAAADSLPPFPLLEMSLDEARENFAAEFRKHCLDEKWLVFFLFEQIVAAL